MTQSPLRELERKWREIAAAPWEECEVSEGGRATDLALIRCADELATLLTTRQEVAPVAWVREALQRSNWKEVHIGYRCMQLKLTYGYATWEKLIGEFESSPAHTSEARDAEVKAMDVLSLAELVDAAVCLESCEAAWCGDEMELAAPRRRLAKAYSGLRKTLFIAQDALECALRNSKRGSRTNAACSTALEYLRRATKQSDDAAMRQEAE